MKALIIEDEHRASKQLMKMIASMELDIDILASLSSVRQSIDWFDKNSLPDFIISDIQLGDGRAFDIFQQLEEIPPVIFTTAYDEYALKAFKNNGIDYLLKPVDPEELRMAIQKLERFEINDKSMDLSLLEKVLKEQKTQYKSRFMIKLGDKIKSIPIEEIAAFYSYGGGSYLKTFEARNYSVDFSMDQLENHMDTRNFFRVNRALIVHIEHIDSIHMWSGSRLKIELKEKIEELGSDILVSRDRVKEFKLWLDR